MAAENASLDAAHIFYGDEHLTAGFTQYPVTSGHVVVDIGNATSFAGENLKDFVHVMFTVRRIAEALSTVSAVRRCALVCDGAACISLIPLHGLGIDWEPITTDALEYHESYPGYITSKNGPKLPDAHLNVIRDLITAVSGLIDPDLTFLGPKSDQNLFAQIIREEVPNWKVWENHSHVAFLTPFANTPGYTVLVPRKHLGSDILSLNGQDYADIVCAAHSCADVLMRAFQVSRCGFIFEGYEIEYAHIKLVPIHERSSHEDIPNVVPQHAEFQIKYRGYVSSQPGPLLSNMESVVDATNAMREALKYERSHPIGP